MNFTSIINSIRKKYPEKEFLIENSHIISYGEFWEKVNFVCRLYQELKVKRGDRILIVLPNSVNFIIYHFAALKIGAISVPVKYEYRFHEIVTIFNDCRPKLFLSCNNWIENNGSILQELKSRIDIISVDNIIIEDEKKEFGICQVGNSNIASINYCYFGHGYPKGAALTHGNHIYAAIGYSKHQGFNSYDKFLIILPMPHVYTLSGCINSSLVTGGTLVIINKYSPKAIFSAVENHQITILTAVPAIFEYLAKFRRKENYNLSSIRLCVTGGDFMPKKLQHEFEQMLKMQIVQGYGLTESLPIICNPPGPRNKPGTLGIPGRKDIEIKIVNENNKKMQVGQIGEILIKSPTTMSKYYNLPADTKNILRDGWLYTGDLGKIDKDGFLHFCGLKKKIFNLYGNKIDPLEVKNVLLKHPSIKKVNIYLETLTNEECIIGSKRICVNIFVKKRQEISKSEILNYCKEQIAGYKTPQKIEIYTI